MTAVIIGLAALVAVLTVLVAGLLRGYGDVLRRLHELENGGAASNGAPPFRTVDTIPGPIGARVEGRDEWAAAVDIEGQSPAGEVVAVRTVGVEHDTVLAFLSSGCEGCGQFWSELDRLPAQFRGSDRRLVVVTKGPEAESPSTVLNLAPVGIDVVMSTPAWEQHSVPGSPYVVVVDGPTGRVKGEGSAASFSQLDGLIEQAFGDGRAGRVQDGRAAVRKPAGDRARELDVDRVLRAAGIGPDDPSLYGPIETDLDSAPGPGGRR